jgi:hypothetical protein
VAHTLDVDDRISCDTLTVTEEFACLSLPPDLLTPLRLPKQDAFDVKTLNWLAKLFARRQARHLKRLREADRQYVEAVGKYKTAMTARAVEIERLTKEHAEERTTFLRSSPI